VNTVRAVYQRLEQKGLIDSHQGSGTFVATTPAKRSEVTRIAAEAAHDAHETGVDAREVAAALYTSSDADEQPTGAKLGRRRALRAQVAVLERALVEMEAVCPGVPSSPSAARSSIPRPGPGPTLLGVDQLEQVRAQLVRRIAAVQAAMDEHAIDEHAALDDRASTAPTAKAAGAPKRSRNTRATARALPAGT
jgi:hypothetical protein